MDDKPKPVRIKSNETFYMIVKADVATEIRWTPPFVAIDFKKGNDSQHTFLMTVEGAKALASTLQRALKRIRKETH